MTRRRMAWEKWSWLEYLNEPGLRTCSWGAEGVWVRMLGYMATISPQRGVFLTPDGKVPTVEQIGELLGKWTMEVPYFLDELEKRAVFSRRDDGAIISRRMYRDAQGAGAPPHVNGTAQTALDFGEPMDSRAHDTRARRAGATHASDTPATYAPENQRREESESESPSISPPDDPPGYFTRRKPGTLLREDWEPPEADLEWARGRYPELDLAVVTEEFKNYWIGEGERKRNWGKTWRNRVIDRGEYQKAGGGRRGGSGARRRTPVNNPGIFD